MLLDARTGGRHWGVDAKPRGMSDKYWRQPIHWNQEAHAAGERWRVFPSMCDSFDKFAPAGQRERHWELIRKTPSLDWLLLTKLAPNIRRFLPSDWGNGYANVWLGVSVEDRKHGLPRIDILREIPAVVRFLSIEPLLQDLGPLDLTGISWVIIGGESWKDPRPMELEWAENVIRQCREQGVAVWFKQVGGSDGDKGGCLLNGIEIKELPRAA
jgi:protein gp37